MFQLTLDITDESIEQSLLHLAQEQGKNVSEVIMMAIEDFITEHKPLHYQKLDPLAHSTVINYPVTDENLDEVKPFAQVKDAADYVKTLRQHTWKKNA
jgi:C4-type Zn-finger protein